jgi:hypothetical protein
MPVILAFKLSLDAPKACAPQVHCIARLVWVSVQIRIKLLRLAVRVQSTGSLRRQIQFPSLPLHGKQTHTNTVLCDEPVTAVVDILRFCVQTKNTILVSTQLPVYQASQDAHMHRQKGASGPHHIKAHCTGSPHKQTDLQ